MIFKRKNINLDADFMVELQPYLKDMGMSLSWLVRYLLKEWFYEQRTGRRTNRNTQKTL